MTSSAIVYTNPFTVFPANDEANAGFIDMTKPSTSDATKLPESLSTSKISSSNEKPLKMKFDAELEGSFKKAPLKEKL
ncbi:unnamed protein product [Rotaria sordida]|uniref:Uncharacterized protein n=1 Tax=Rotaria sordida TaxID=392033 RepID=A0A813VM36_9BILA|nr:unnamed protein product [Rotaria sordida]CAF0838600.1 unnamed protein product [Rotaria sordida]CAF0856592.1 unnamed protein product [Rotaria sordida]CAF3983496.1 unnamed protein product [Rotaria sordida]CAF4006275.1 unnamed protein product [Rotaria sordida]